VNFVEPSSQDQPSAYPLPPERPPSPPLAERARAFPVTFILIGVTLAVFLLQILSDALLGADLVLLLGAKSNPAIKAGQWWRFISPVFVHAGLLHFGVNMYSLYIIGPAVERFYTSWRFLLVYLMSGIGGVILSFALSESLSVGASGAIFGLIGALGGFFFQHRKLLNVTHQLRHLITVTLMNLTLGLMPGIDNWGHIGGLVTGLALSWWLGPHLELVRDLDGVRIVDQQPFEKIRLRAGFTVLVMIVILALLVIS
jgi:rhomboid protease GluP